MAWRELPPGSSGPAAASPLEGSDVLQGDAAVLLGPLLPVLLGAIGFWQ